MARTLRLYGGEGEGETAVVEDQTGILRLHFPDNVTLMARGADVWEFDVVVPAEHPHPRPPDGFDDPAPDPGLTHAGSRSGVIYPKPKDAAVLALRVPAGDGPA